MGAAQSLIESFAVPAFMGGDKTEYARNGILEFLRKFNSEFNNSAYDSIKKKLAYDEEFEKKWGELCIPLPPTDQNIEGEMVANMTFEQCIGFYKLLGISIPKDLMSE